LLEKRAAWLAFTKEELYVLRAMIYQGKIGSLQEIFGTSAISLEGQTLRVVNATYPIVDDVIVLLPPQQWTSALRRRITAGTPGAPGGASLGSASEVSSPAFAEDIQFTFGEEWQSYDRILPEHAKEFSQYFDLVDLASLSKARVCDLGCGSGRWSYFLKDRCKELILVDFSDSIFAARKNLSGATNCLFFMADLTHLPFRSDFADLLFCLGVLHHLPTPCLQEVRNLKPFAPRLLIFLYYALDNRPWHYRLLLKIVTGVRLALSRIRHPAFRKGFSLLATYGVYLPLITLGRLLKPFRLSSAIPLYDFYHSKSLRRIEQDAYDRFFTRIEQRVSRREILGLQDSFRRVTVSDSLPYWHFLCEQ
jgi:SAM-dependent methyltransferase